MKIQFVVSMLFLFFSSSIFARDDIGQYSIADAMNREDAREVLGESVAFYFGDQPHPAIARNLGEFPTNKKTNGVGKSDEEACQWVFFSALISLRDRALKEGGNAVINIKSNYRNNITTSSDSFTCGAGALMAGVALVGTVVYIEQ